MWGVARDATYIGGRVNRVDRIHVLRPPGVARHTTGADFLRRSILKGENFRDIAAPGNVRRTRAMACFASVPLGTLLRIERRYKMRRLFESLVEPLRRYVFMAGLADFGTHITSGTGSLRLRCRRCFGW